MQVKQAEEWTKSHPFRYEDNLQSHEKIKAPKFIPSYDKNCVPTSMSCILGWEYGRIWLKERGVYIQKRDSKKPKKIENDFASWIKKHDPKSKKIVNPTGLRPKAENAESKHKQK